jgi:hypothetical protein
LFELVELFECRAEIWDELSVEPEHAAITMGGCCIEAEVFTLNTQDRSCLVFQWSSTVLADLESQVRDLSVTNVALVAAHSKASLDEAFKHTLDVAHVLLVRTTSRDNDVIHVRDGDVRRETTQGCVYNAHEGTW